MSAFANVTFTVRPCVPADIERMASIERVSFSDPWSFETLSAAFALRHMRVLVAEESGKSGGQIAAAPALVGYVLALVMADEGEIADVAVAPEARRRGVARVLLDQMILDMIAEGVRALYLEVRESNAAARGLYRSLEFEEVGRRRDYYQHPTEDALLLRRELVPS